MSEWHLECYHCHHRFEVEPDDLRPYHSAYIQGNRPPEYTTRCPTCRSKNVMRLPENAQASAPILGKPASKK